MRKALLLVALWLCVAPAASTSAELRIVARPGDLLPNVPDGWVLRLPGEISLDGRGQVVFTALAGPPNDPNPANWIRGVWRWDDGALTTLALSGLPLPTPIGPQTIGQPQMLLDVAGTTVLERSALFFAPFASPVNWSVWAVDEDGPRHLFGHDAELPKNSENSPISSFQLRSTNARGDALLRLQSSSGASNRESVWLCENGVFARLLQEGSPAPVGPPGAVVGTFSSAIINDRGDVLARWVETGSKVVVAMRREGAWILLARTGEPHPTLPPGVNLANIGAEIGLTPSGAAIVSFTAKPFAWVDGQFQPLVDPDAPLPGFPEHTAIPPQLLVFNDALQCAFYRDLLIDGFQRRVIWTTAWDPGLTHVMREGDVVEDGVAFSLSLLRPRAVDDLGRILALSDLKLVVGQGVIHDAYLFAVPGRAPQIVARVGGTVEFAPGVEKTVAQIARFGPSDAQGRAPVDLRFTDATFAFALFEPPPPCVADLTGDGVVNSADLASLLASWGLSGPADLNADGIVRFEDLASLLGAWGPCP